LEGKLGGIIYKEVEDTHRKSKKRRSLRDIKEGNLKA
jgi:hypothetical protein